jgi:uncharacterized protein
MMLFLLVTTRCNFHCPYCFIKAPARRDMTASTAERAINTLLCAGRLQSIVITGGEPLLNREALGAAVRTAETRGIPIHLCTNGTLVSRRDANFMRAAGVRATVSIDGPHGRRSADGGARGRVIRGMERLMIAGVLEKAHMTVTGADAPDLCANIEWLLTLGVRRIAWSYALDRSWTRRHVGALEEEIGKVAVLLRAHEKKGDPFTAEYLRAEEEALREPSGIPRENCGAAREMLAVTPEGEIYPCHALVYKEGSFLGTIGEGISRLPARAFLARAGAVPAQCRICGLASVCRRCPAVNLELSGSYGRPSGLMCAITKTHFRALKAHNKRRATDGPRCKGRPQGPGGSSRR